MRIVAGLLCMLLIAGCSEKDKIPSNVLDKEQMGAILWDMMQADQYAANYLIKDSAKVNVKMETLKLYEEVFRLHKVTRDEFRKSFQFYQDRPDITRVLFDSLIARGNRQRAESYTHPPAATPVPSVPVTKPPVAAPGKPGGTFPNRPGGTPLQPRYFPGRDSARLRGRGLHFLPGQAPVLPSGAQPFLGRQSGKPVKAGEVPFKNPPKTGSDSLSKNKH